MKQQEFCKGRSVTHPSPSKAVNLELVKTKSKSTYFDYKQTKMALKKTVDLKFLFLYNETTNEATFMTARVLSHGPFQLAFGQPLAAPTKLVQTVTSGQ